MAADAGGSHPGPTGAAPRASTAAPAAPAAGRSKVVAMSSRNGASSKAKSGAAATDPATDGA